ncbi:MAG: Trk system potassium transporter TrkA [Lachnospiraceae bacterium]|nr:Trk system potassium transporter TrkA [Ruminococcus sp.]MCM1274464.1 Trk system potassium transporter TrkA [Lachnospiraceae bacterium]
MKMVIIGNGKAGNSLASMLSNEGHDVTVVDINAAALEKTQNTEDVMCIEGNGTDADVLRDAGANKAAIVIAATHYDEVNLLCCLIAKKLGAKRTISRVRNPEYYKQIDLIRDELGLSMAINPEAITADEILRVLITPEAAKVEVFEKGRMELVEYKIPDNSPLLDCSLIEIYKRTKIKLLICAVQRDSEIYIPGGNFVLRSGDRINIAATHKDIEQFFRFNGSIKDKVKSCMIVGGGRICYYLTKSLLGMGMHVKIIENDLEQCRMLAQMFPKASVIHGDGTDQDLLLEEGIRDADAFVAITGIDEENIIMSLYAKNNSNAKVVTKVNRESYVNLTSQIGLDCIIFPKYLTTSSVLGYVRSLDNTESNIESIYHIVDNRVEAAEFKIKEHIPKLTGIPLKEIRLKKNILVCSVVRGRQVMIADGNTAIELGDSVVVVSKEHRFADIRDILE